MKKPSSGYVYVASVKNHPDLCKIGYTRRANPEERIAELNANQSEFTFSLHGCEFSERPARLENMCHEYFSSSRVKGEIFKISAEDAINGVKKNIGKWYTITSPEDLKGFNCLSLGVYNLCVGNEELASALINAYCFETNTRGTSRLKDFDGFNKFMIEGLTL